MPSLFLTLGKGSLSAVIRSESSSGRLLLAFTCRDFWLWIFAHTEAFLMMCIEQIRYNSGGAGYKSVESPEWSTPPARQGRISSGDYFNSARRPKIRIPS